MDHEKLAGKYADAVEAEVAAKHNYDGEKARLVSVRSVRLAKAYRDKRIQGKNADERKHQEQSYLAGDEFVLSQEEQVEVAFSEWLETLREKVYFEALYKLQIAALK